MPHPSQIHYSTFQAPQMPTVPTHTNSDDTAITQVVSGVYLSGTKPLRDGHVVGDIDAILSCMPRPPRASSQYRQATHTLVLGMKSNNSKEKYALTQHRFEQAIVFITEHVRAGRGVLVHCSHGRHRSANVVVAYLVKSGVCKDRAEALDLVKSKRPSVSPETKELWSVIGDWI